MNNTSKGNRVKVLIDNMEFEQVISQEFDADDIDVETHSDDVVSFVVDILEKAN